MNSIKYLFLMLVFFISKGHAQELYVEAGFGNAFFENYVNNLGENTLDDTYTKPLAPQINTGVRLNIFKERLHFNIGVGYHKYEIKTGVSVGNTKVPLMYDLSYLTSKVGINFSVIRWKSILFQLHTHISYNWLMSGTNSYNNQTFNLTQANTFDPTLLNFNRGVSLEYEFSGAFSMYVSYNKVNSFEELHEDTRSEEKYTLLSNSFNIGVLFNFKNDN